MEAVDAELLILLQRYRRHNHATLVEVAIKQHNVKLLDYLLKKENVLEQSLMWVAVKGRAHNVVKYLFRQGLKIDVPGEFYLVTAAKTAQVGVVRSLVELGANVNTKDEEGCCPLSRCLRGVPQAKIFTMANLLLDNGADVNSVDNLGHTPLIHCVERRFCTGMSEVLKMLFRRGADERAKDCNGLSVERILLGRGWPSKETLPFPILKSVQFWRDKTIGGLEKIPHLLQCSSPQPLSGRLSRGR